LAIVSLHDSGLLLHYKHTEQQHNKGAGNMELIKLIEQDGNRSVGIWKDGDLFLAMTFSQSKEFKTLAGAQRWLAKRGF